MSEKKLYLIERMQRIVVLAADGQAAEKLAADLHGDDLCFRAQSSVRTLREIVKPEHVPIELLDEEPFSDGVCLECGDTHEDSETVAKILARRSRS